MSGTKPGTSHVHLGSLLGGKFRVRRELGRGGMAVVYEAENVDIGKQVAVKVLSEELAHSKTTTERFLREARAAARIDSPYICEVYDIGMFHNRPFLVMELLKGETLYMRLARERRLPVPAALRIVHDAARGLARAHEEEIVHRDLKPENLFLARGSSGEQQTKIVDFGLAKFYEPSLDGGESVRLTRAGALFGTPAYMSPEQARADVPVDSRADLWALGCIAYEMLVGRTVWTVDQGVAMILAQVAEGPLPIPSQFAPDLPRSFDTWFKKALARDPQERFGRATDMASALSVALEQATGAPALGPAKRDTDPAPQVHATKRNSAAGPRWGRLGRGTTGALLASVAIACWWLLNSGSRAGTDPQSPRPVETADYAATIARAQEHLSLGRFDAALESFDAAFEDGRKNTARSLRSHARAVEPFIVNNACSVRGLGHPRPFEVRTESSSPALALANGGVLAAWASQYEEGKERTVFAAQLDPLLRRVSAARPVTPEAVNARAPQLLLLGSEHLLLYTDAQKSRSQVRLRRIRPNGPDGVVPVSSDPDASTHSPRGAVAPDGSLWVAYSQLDEGGAHELWLTHFDDQLQPLEQAMPLTELASERPARRVATVSGLSAHRDSVSVAFVTQRGKKRRLYQVDLPVEDPRAPLLPSPRDPGDRLRGQLRLEAPADAGTEPNLVCTSAGCLTVWADERNGAQAAFRSSQVAQEGWQTAFAAAGASPAANGRPSEPRLVAGVAWYEDNRLRFAEATDSGLGSPTVVGRVGGLQPPPVVVAGVDPGRWYVGWRTYEASVLEAFVARVDCPQPQN